MRLIKQSILQRDGSGSATLLPEDPEDMVGYPSINVWHTRPNLRLPA